MTFPDHLPPEFSRMADLRQIGLAPIHLEADADERRRLAGRFGLAGIESLVADLTLEPDGAVVRAVGRLTAQIVQSCSVSGDPFPVRIDEPVSLRFVPAGKSFQPDAEIEIDAADCDEIEYEGTSFDLGEAVAQSLALAIDPFAEGPNADAARKAAGLDDPSASGPFAALSRLRNDP